MQRYLLAALIWALCVSPALAAETELKTEKDKVSYSIGMAIGSGMARDQLEINEEAFMAGIKDGTAGKVPRLTPEEMSQVMNAFRQKRQDALQKAMVLESSKNLAAAKEFLTKKKTEEGVKATKSGLLYKVVKEGKGKKPNPGDVVTIHYKGTNIAGEPFDSSYERGQPVSLPLDRLIPGWKEALPMMKEGSKWILYVPPQLGYGERGAPPKIGPNQALIFEVELFKSEPHAGGDLKKMMPPPSDKSKTPPPSEEKKK